MRRPALLMLLASSVGLPYALHHPGTQGLVDRVWSSSRVDTSDEVLIPPDTVALPGMPAVPTRIEGPRFQRFTDVFRFDLTPAWVMGRWSRVSTAAGDFGQQGYRVPLVTGTQHDDLAGSLTYYFDVHDQLVRISFTGTTGDTRRFVNTICSVYGLERDGADPPIVAHFAARHAGKTSKLDITVPPVVAGHRPHQRFHVELELYHPAPHSGPGKSQQQYLLPY